MAEQIKSPISGGITAVRNRVPSNLFSAPNNRQTQQPVVQDSLTPRLIQNNTLLLSGVVRQLGVVTQQIQGLQTGLKTVSDSLTLQIALERQREAAEAKRQNDLAEEALRSNQESELEKKTQAALITPFARIAGKAQITLNSLGKFFSTLFFGWLVDKSVLALQALSDGNTQRLKQIGLTVAGGLLTLGGLWLSAKFGIFKLVGLLGRIAFRTKGLTLGKLIRTPFAWLGNIFRGVLNRMGNIPQLAWIWAGRGSGDGYNKGGIVKSPLKLNDGGIAQVDEQYNEWKEKNINGKRDTNDTEVFQSEDNSNSSDQRQQLIPEKRDFNWVNPRTWLDNFTMPDFLVGPEIDVNEEGKPRTPQDQIEIDNQPVEYDSYEDWKKNNQFNFPDVDYSFGANESGRFNANPEAKNLKEIQYKEINQQVETGPVIIPIPINRSRNNSLDNSGKTSGTENDVPSINALNDTNTYVYGAYSQFNISPVR